MPTRKTEAPQTGRVVKPAKRSASDEIDLTGYESVLSGLVDLLESARRASARAGNAVMTATYLEVGRRIVEYEQRGANRAAYGERLIERLSADLKERFGRGFGRANL
jgi:hypothetical protein